MCNVGEDPFIRSYEPSGEPEESPPGDDGFADADSTAAVLELLKRLGFQ